MNILFFVISGFIMVYSTRKSDGSLAYVGDFAIRRIAKVWPAYAAATLMYVFTEFNGWSYLYTSYGDLANQLLFIPTNPAQPEFFGTDTMPLKVGWTLNYEMYFYAVFGVSMLFGRYRWAALSAWMFSFLIVLPIKHGTWTIIPMNPMGFRHAIIGLMTNPIVWDFVFGMIIGKLYLSRVSFRKASHAKIAVAASVLIALVGLRYDYPGIPGPYGWGGQFALIFGSVVMLSKHVRIYAPRPLVYLGNISYTLYLVHETAFHMVINAMHAVTPDDHLYTWTYGLVWVATAIALAAVSHPVLEGLLHDTALRWLRKPSFSDFATRTRQQ